MTSEPGTRCCSSSWPALRASSACRRNRTAPGGLALVGSLKAGPLAGLIDPAAERARLEKAVEKRQGECQRIEGKLGNERFVSGAPAEVVEKEREKLTAAQDALGKLQAQLEALTQF